MMWATTMRKDLRIPVLEGFLRGEEETKVMASVPQPSQTSSAKGLKWAVLLLGLLILGGAYWAYSQKRGGGEGVENLSPPSIQTGIAAEVTEASALLTAYITYGDYRQVDVCFRWREAGGTWNYVPWKRYFTYPTYVDRLTTLSPGRTYEFQALLRYDGREIPGEIRSFTTLRPGGGMSMSATVRGVYFPEMSFTARLTSEQKVLLTVQSGETIQAGDWEWRAENEDGPVTPYAPGTDPLVPGRSLTLDVSAYVRGGSLGVGDVIRIRHKPSTFTYRVVISS